MAKIIALFLIALLGGLGGGFGLSYIVYQPRIQNLSNTTTNLQSQVANLNSTLRGLLNMSGAGIRNQVQVSGTVSETQSGTIEFRNYYGNITSSVPITNGRYSILLVGGQSYDVYIYLADELDYSYYGYSYVPVGVTTFTANF
jgi:hypothetical protein